MSKESSVYLLGADVGTQNTKGILVTVGGEVVARHPVEHGVSSPRPGWAEHDAEQDWWSDFAKICRVMLERSGVDPRQIAAIGVSGISPDVVLMDDQGFALRPAILYGIDSRAHAEIAWLNHELGLDSPNVGPAERLTTQSAAPKVLWLRKNEPERWHRTRKILGGAGFLVCKLTGAYVVDSSTVGGLAPLYSRAKGGWDIEACERFGVPIDLLPDIHPPTEVVGTVTPSAAEQTGLAVGTPVTCGTSDGYAEWLSAGMVNVGDACVTFGTTFCLSLLTAEPRRHPLLWGGREMYGGLYGIGGTTNASGGLLRWFRDQFGQLEMQAERQLGLNAFHLLSDEASTVPPGSDGLVVLPYFHGERTPIHDGQARGLILGLTTHHTRRHIYRALLEGSAYSLRHHFDLMAEIGIKPKRLIAAGGGSQDSLWTQVVSDVLGMPQECVEFPHGAPLGDAYLAGMGVGIFKDFGPLKSDFARIGRRVMPQPAATAVYDRYYRVYRRLYDRTMEEMHELASLAGLPT